MFEKGDAIVCTDNNGVGISDILILHKKYIVDNVSIFADGTIMVVLHNVESIFMGDRFKKLSTIRKEKIDKLKNGTN